MSYLSLSAGDTTTSTVKLRIGLESVPQNSFSELKLKVFKHQLSQTSADRRLQKIFSTTISQPCRSTLLVEDLESSAMFKFCVDLLGENGEVLYSGSTHASTKSGPVAVGDDLVDEIKREIEYSSKPKGYSDSENVIKRFAEIKNERVNIFENRKEINRSVLQGRTFKAWDKYVNSNYKFSKPKFQAELRKRRTWLVATGIEALEEIYDYKLGSRPDDGHNFLQNDWGMGPFYSYDKSFK